MNKNDLATAVAERTDLGTEKSKYVVDAIFDEITYALCRRESVGITGFGAFSLRQRRARSGRNPQTGASISIAASTSVGFKPGKNLKTAVDT